MWLLVDSKIRKCGCSPTCSYVPTRPASIQPSGFPMTLLFFFGMFLFFGRRRRGGGGRRALGASDPRAWVHFMRGNCHLVQASMCLWLWPSKSLLCQRMFRKKKKIRSPLDGEDKCVSTKPISLQSFSGKFCSAVLFGLWECCLFFLGSWPCNVKLTTKKTMGWRIQSLLLPFLLKIKLLHASYKYIMPIWDYF